MLFITKDLNSANVYIAVYKCTYPKSIVDCQKVPSRTLNSYQSRVLMGLLPLVHLPSFYYNFDKLFFNHILARIPIYLLGSMEERASASTGQHLNQSLTYVTCYHKMSIKLPVCMQRCHSL